MATFTLELLHVTDQEASTPAITDAPNLSAVLNALEAQDLGDDGVADNTLRLSSGDAIIPGVFFQSSEAVFGYEGIADIAIQNELGFQAIALGNHEFDLGTRFLSELITGQDVTDDSDEEDGFVDTVPQSIGAVFDQEYTGTNFSYLSSNLDFSTDAFMAPLAVDGGQAPQDNTISSSVVIDVNGEPIAVVGATTPTLAGIANPGDVTILPEDFDASPEAISALAAEIQAEVNDVLAANADVNKVILLAHMQRIDIEQALAAELENVDIIVAGGSNTRLLDETDRLRDGDTAQGEYPIVVENAGGTDTLVVNTDGSYKYVGRLVIDFDVDGNIITDSYDAAISGAYATDAAGVAALGAEDLVDPEVQAIVDAIEEEIIRNESNVFGVSDVFLNGNRSGTFADNDPDGVRTQETNLGNLTADANLAIAKGYDSDVVVSIKNGGGIRASIGDTVVPAGETEAVRTITAPLVDSEGNEIKAAGGISQNDIATVLAFNNGLTLLSLKPAELVNYFELNLGALPGVSGGFPQVSGIRVSFDQNMPAGERVVSMAIVDEATGQVLDTVVADGDIQGDRNRDIRIVTLDFLARSEREGFGNLSNPNRVDLIDLNEDGVEDDFRTGDAIFEADGTEQDALAEYLLDNFAPDSGNAFSQLEVGPEADARIQQIAFRDGADAIPSGGLVLEEIVRFDNDDLEDAEGAAEIAKHEDGKIYVTNGAEDVIDVLDVLTGTKEAEIDLTTLPGYAGLNSVDVKNGVIAVAIEGDGAANGQIAFYQAGTLALLGTVEVGNLPDMVTFTPDGAKVLVANEGEPVSATVNPEGSVSIIDISAGIENATTTTVGFGDIDVASLDDGIRTFGDFTVAEDFEPEFIAVSPDGQTAYVSAQENNALVIIDVDSGEITDIVSQGTVDFSQAGNEADVSNEDNAINIQNWPVEAFRMADGIASFEIDGATYVIAANEGDGREYTVDEEGDAFEGGEILDVDRVRDLTLDPTAFPNAEELQQDENLGRLEVSLTDGDTDGDGDFDQLFAFGGRSVSIHDAQGNVVWDSGALFAHIAATFNADEFQGNNGDFDGRSDDGGTEPESVTVGQIDDRTYAFVGLERDSGIVVMDISNPVEPVFVQYFNGSDVSNDVSPEGMQFVSADDSPTGEPVLVVAYEVSGSTVVYSLTEIAATSGTAEGPGDAVGDFNGDGTDDFAWRNTDDGDVALWLMDDGVPSFQRPGNVSEEWVSEATGDFRGGAPDDILWRNTETDAVVVWELGGVGPAFRDVGTATSDWSVEGSGAFAGGPADDILWRNQDSGDVVLWEMSEAQPSFIRLGSATSDWSIEGTGDFNGDSTDDVVWRNATTDEVVVWELGGPRITFETAGSATSDWSVQGTGDFNGDGTDDIAWRNIFTGDIAIWEMNDSQVETFDRPGTANFEWSVIGTGDFNGDEVDDILWRNETSGEVVNWALGEEGPSFERAGNAADDWGIVTLNPDDPSV